MSSYICRHCQTPQPPDAQFCMNCGRLLHEPEQEMVTLIVTRAEMEEQAEATEKMTAVHPQSSQLPSPTAVQHVKSTTLPPPVARSGTYGPLPPSFQPSRQPLPSVQSLLLRPWMRFLLVVLIFLLLFGIITQFLPGNPLSLVELTDRLFGAKRIVLLAGDGLYNLDSDSGELKWKQALPGLNESTRLLVQDGTVYLLGSQLSTYDLRSGQPKWSLKLAQSESHDLAVTDGAVFVRQGQTLAAYAADSGVLLWKKELPGEVGRMKPLGEFLCVVFENKLVVVGTKDGAMKSYALGEAGEWSIEGALGHTLILKKSTYTEKDEELLGFDVEAAKIAWKLPSKGSTDLLTVSKDRFYVISEIDRKYEVHSHNREGQLQWSFPLQDSARRFVLRSQDADALYQFAEGTLYAWSLEDGHQLWKVASGIYKKDEVNESGYTDGSVIVYSDGDSVIGFQAADGQKKWTVPSLAITGTNNRKYTGLGEQEGVLLFGEADAQGNLAPAGKTGVTLGRLNTETGAAQWKITLEKSLYTWAIG
ncbi:outer membrane protein assembly factor BamB [Thermosporothrix hazakensis]|uniref:Outer membrane protein assembly factor BamB n=2 Tax=Thermosporothrix TaxID=768650 RepID=A0A326U5H1_THEHA|nr:PQQ-binding-like beta-propeller repeat protein [Thermosporothrix hazakensis]PZW29196.1 outer membrane protein assembly factor BamB [Thermosporothrix hazakensis]